MERLQSEVERLGVRRSQGSQDNAHQAVEAGCSHVQQVNTKSSENPHFLIIKCQKCFAKKKGERFSAEPALYLYYKSYFSDIFKRSNFHKARLLIFCLGAYVFIYLRIIHFQKSENLSLGSLSLI